MTANAKALWTIAHRAARLPTYKNTIDYILANVADYEDQGRAIRMMSKAAWLRVLAGQDNPPILPTNPKDNRMVTMGGTTP